MARSGSKAAEKVKVREVAGVLPSRDALEAAVDDLLRAGFDRSDIDLMASPESVARKLGGIYAPAQELADVPHTPREAFIAREDVNVPLATVAGILTYVGATAAALGVVAPGGALGVALAAAAAGGAATGSIGALLARSLGRKQAEDFERRLALGGLVLWVRLRSPEREERAQEILKRHGAEAVRVHEIEIDKRFEDMPLSSLVVDPWLGSEPLGQEI